MPKTRSRDAAADQEQRVDVSPEALAGLIARGTLAVAEDVEASDAHALLVSVTHDLRSPLGAMLMLIERLRSGQSGPLTPQQERQLGLLYEAAFGVMTLTTDALDTARGHTPSTPTDRPIEFSLGQVWHEVRSLVHPIAEERGLVLRWGGPVQDRRLGHPAVLNRVLLNLVTNALKYTERGGVTVQAVDGEGEIVHFSVQDTGSGLPAEVQQVLIHDGAGSAPLVVPGRASGLGLSLCRQWLAAHGSRLEFRAAHPVGSRLEFALKLPCPR
ncbi:MAG: HAMP domain-containing histidine kinase [Gemmatimonadaceae bacterium]|nr:HAMP domain-containing histidine kinase [Gemmatimonadaceae bacterium]